MKIAYKPDLSGKTAVVTGGAGVLCSEFCRAYAECGAKVAVLGRTYEKAERLASEIRASGGQAMAVSADVTSPEQLAEAHEKIKEKFGSCSVLVNGAGGNSPAATTSDEFFSPGAEGITDGKTFFDLDPSAFSKVFSLNITGTVLATQEFAKDMTAGGGCIINISSMNAYTPLTKIPAYSAAKAGVSNFTEWLAVYFAGTGIRCNAIAPGFFLTEQNRTLLTNPDGSLTPRSGKILAATPMGRFGRPEELIGTLLFLTDDAASGFITGTVIPVDGGFRSYSGV